MVFYLHIIYPVVQKKLLVAFNSADKGFSLDEFMNRNAIYYTYSCMTSTAQRQFASKTHKIRVLTYVYICIYMVYFCLQVNIDTYICICCHSIIGANKIGQATAAPATEADKACEYGESNASLALLAASMSCLLAKRLMVRVCNAPSDWKTNNAMSKRHVKDVIGAILCYYSLQRSFNAMHYSYTNCHSSRTRKN